MRTHLRPALAALTAAMLACTSAGKLQEARQFGADLERSATARAGSGQEANLNSPALTAQAVATNANEAFVATQAAQQALALAAQDATATVVAPIEEELRFYNIDPEKGRVLWVHPPILLSIEGYLQSDYANNFMGTVVADFVLAADVTWNTRTGLSGCGFAIHSDGNREAINQYLVIASRAGNGTVYFLTQQDGEIVRQENLYAGTADSRFAWQNDSTNRIAVVGSGTEIEVYSNRARLGSFRAGEFTRGFVAMAALSESGLTVCQFENIWLWASQ